MAVRVEKEKFTRGRDGRMRWQVRWMADTRTEATTSIPETYDGLQLSGSSGSPWIDDTDGRFLVDATYEGWNGTQNGPDESFDQAEISAELREVPIENFPNRDLLVENYAAYEEDGRLKFPSKIPNTSLQGNGLSASEENDNPLFKATTYLVEYELAVHSFIRRKVPQALLKKQLTIVSELPSVFEYTGETKNWFVRPLRRRRVGNMWEITVEYEQVDEDKARQAMADLRRQSRKKSSLDTFFR